MSVFIGPLFQKCNMDVNPIYPSYTEENADVSITETNALIDYIRNPLPHNELVEAIISPRFALSCTPDLLRRLGELAAEKAVPVQTHVSENKAEIRQVLKEFPDCRSYTKVYDSFGLLRKGTILGHGCWLEGEELELIKEKEAGVSHCPTSNFNLRSGAAGVADMLARKVKVGYMVFIQLPGIHQCFVVYFRWGWEPTWQVDLLPPSLRRFVTPTWRRKFSSSARHQP